ncbi:MAG: hypothetical protein IPO48_20125 [Saprospiraceae bacterium]|nr:hypothetical protein [Saprospiraceae bacterium]
MVRDRDNGFQFNVASLSRNPSGEGIFHLTHAKDGAEITLFCARRIRFSGTME